MGFLEKVYDNVPIFMQNTMCTINGLRFFRSRYGKQYWEFRDYFKYFDTLPENKKKEIQLHKLKSFLKYAVDNSKFYSDLYNDFDISEINNIEDLKKLPIVDKEMLRTRIEDVYTIPKHGAIIGNTGGTTGTPLTVRYTVQDFNERMAQLDNFKARVGFYNLKMKRASFTGKHIVPPGQNKKVYWRYNAACKQLLFSSFHLSDDNLDAYVECLNYFKPQALDGFFSSMCDIATYIKHNSLKLEFEPIAIFPTSETLTPFGRELLEDVFHAKVYDQYASSEGAPFVTECPNQNLHMELASGVFERLDGSDNEILVTSFTTHGTPLIRYRIGDRMKFPSAEKCDCGLGGVIVDEIQGRNLDFLYSPSGAKINAGNISNILKHIPNGIIKTQFEQNYYDQITVFMVIDPDKFREEYKDILMQEIRQKFGYRMNVYFKIVEEIPREKSGKFRMIKNNISDSD